MEQIKEIALGMRRRFESEFAGMQVKRGVKQEESHIPPRTANT